MLRHELTIEACMRGRQPLLVTIITVDVESTKAIHTLKFFEAVERYFTGSGDEL